MTETIVKLVLGKLEALTPKEAELLLGVDDQIKSLRVKLLWIQSFLKDAEEKRRDNERIKAWVGLMRDIAYDAEDVIDMYFLRFELQRQQQRSFLAKSTGSIKGLPTLHTLGKKMENINARFQEIVACKSHFGIDEIHTEGPSASRPKQRLWKRSSRQEEVDTVGLDEAVQSLTRQLTDEKLLHRVIISIVGMGGSGKTTLVGRVYNSTFITNYFPTRLWISVSQNFREEDLLQVMAEGFIHMKKKDIVEMGVQQLVDTISKHLEEKKYLLVIDDIWSREAWKYIKRALPNRQNGSRIILTTRIESVARVDDGENIDIHEMKLLNDDQSWELFCKKALGEPSCPEGLQEVGRMIVAKCRSLPLAIVIMGGLLRRKNQTFTEWNKVLQRISIEFREGEDQTQRILGLSYDDLPHHLKPCFLYLALFPEDSKISAIDLLRMWIAEGFVPDKQNLTMEEVAEEYLEDLIGRSMVRLESRDDLGTVDKVSIHDLLLDLALSEAKEMNFLCVYDKQKYSAQPSDSRRLAIHDHIEEYSSLNSSTPKLRSLLHARREPPLSDWDDTDWRTPFFTPVSPFQMPSARELALEVFRIILLSLQQVIRFPCHGSKLLRVINLKQVTLKSLPKEIGNMIQLRYLGLQSTWLDKLPSSIGNLCNLQTLDISKTYIKSLPKAFWRIQTLRHVLLDMHYFKDKPKIVSKLNDLQTLDGVVCGSWMQSGLVMMRNLRNLNISAISYANADALVIALKRLDRLVSLSLTGHSLPLDEFTFSTHQHCQYLYLNGPPRQQLIGDTQLLLPNLRILFCQHTKLEQRDIIILAKLPELRHLFLCNEAYMDTQLVFHTQIFPKLETLNIGPLLKLENLGVDEGGLPCVTKIRLFDCKNLKMLPDGMRHLTSLVALYVNKMPTIASRIQHEGAEDYNKIKHVPSIVVNKLVPDLFLFFLRFMQSYIILVLWMQLLQNIEKMSSTPHFKGPSDFIDMFSYQSSKLM